MAEKYLLDTNILIYYFNDQPEVPTVFDNIETGIIEPCYCPLTWVELLCYPDLTGEEADKVRAFLRLLHCVELTEAILDRAAQIRRDYRLKLADGIIAACALMMDCTLVTRNVEDFKRVEQLPLFNPFMAS